jgi:hypothetical protein
MLLKGLAAGFFSLTLCAFANCQTSSGNTGLDSPAESNIRIPVKAQRATGFDVARAGEPVDNHDAGTSSSSAQTSSQGVFFRGVRRGLRDQAELYSAPFHPSNLKRDALVLVGTGVLIATDRQTSRALPTGHVGLYRNISHIGLGTTAASAGGIWAYGVKKRDEHAKETGELELETLANTFLIYTPLQFIAGRERPEEGTGNGRFWRHAGFNTSFPSGHALFSWSMATVIAHEYPKPWVKWLAYGAATSVSMGRFLGRQHYASDVFVGSVLGYAIATHIFHARCDPQRSDACTR